MGQLIGRTSDSHTCASNKVRHLCHVPRHVRHPTAQFALPQLHPAAARRSTRPMPRAAPPLVLALLLACAAARAGPDAGVVALSRKAPVALLTGLVVEPGASFTARLLPQAPEPFRAVSVLVESWYDPDLYRENRPDPLLLAERARVPNPFHTHRPPSSAYGTVRFSRRARRLAGRSAFRTRGAARRWGSRSPHARHRQGHRREPHVYLSDAEAFLTWRPYQYILLRNVSADDDWHIRILNHNGTVLNAMQMTVRFTMHVAPLNATVSDESPQLVSAIEEQSLCPYGPTLYSCSGHGHCVSGKCVCLPQFGGRYCESRIHPIPVSPFIVPSERMIYFRYVVPHNGSVAIMLQISGIGVSGAQPILFAKKLDENGGRSLPVGPPLPTVYDLHFTDMSAFRARLPYQRIVRSDLQRGDTIFIGVYNYHRLLPGWRISRYPNSYSSSHLSPHAPAHVRLEAFPCVERRLGGFGAASVQSTNARSLVSCPMSTGDEQWELSFTVLVLPFLLGTLTLLTMVVCVSIWAGVFRQHLFEAVHGHLPSNEDAENVRRRDKLSDVEVNAMFPSFMYTKRETAALSAVGDVCCSVCLCSYEEGEALRRLACGHSYHSMCLDQWLRTNAICPRCRKPARIHSESSRGRLVAIGSRLFATLYRMLRVRASAAPFSLATSLLVRTEGRDQEHAVLLSDSAN